MNNIKILVNKLTNNIIKGLLSTLNLNFNEICLADTCL